MVTVEVRHLPEIITSELDLVVQAGESIEIPCDTFGIPEPTIRWRKGAEEVETSIDGRISLTREGTLQFIIVTVSHIRQFISNFCALPY